MRLSFSLLDSARRNPARFGQSFSAQSGFPRRANFRLYLSSSISRFHGGMTKQQVQDYFISKCNEKLQDQRHFHARLSHYTGVLGRYCDGYARQNCRFVESNKRVVLHVGHHELSGRVERFDIRLPDGYRATATQLERDEWRTDIRWPLIQSAIAQEFGRPPSEVEVGVFCFENGRYDYDTFSEAEIAAAVTEAESVLTQVEANIP
jgi:hypothetical protein